MAASEKKIFILGGLFSVLILLTLLIVQSVFRNDTAQEDGAFVADSQDPLLSKQLSPRDVLPDDEPLITFIDPKRGSENPTVTIVEFSDFACPFCKTVQEPIKRILEKYPEDVQHVWKDAPHESLYRDSMNAHIAARCAQKQQRFWEFHDELFDNQNALSDFTYETIAANTLRDAEAWRLCFNDKEEHAKVERGILEAEVLGVDATPYFFINETRLSGTISFEQLDTLISEEIIKTNVQGDEENEL